MLRHWTPESRLPQVVRDGALKSGDQLGVARRFDSGYVSFEKDPPTPWLGDYLAEQRGERHFALDFDESRLVSERTVGSARADLVKPYGPLNDPGELASRVGEYVGVKAPVSLGTLTEESRRRIRDWCRAHGISEPVLPA